MDFRTAGLTWVGGKTVSYSSTLEIFVLPANLKKKKKKSTLPKFTPQSSLTDLEAFNSFLGLPKYLADKESACQGRRHRYNSWVRKIPWSRNPLLYSCLDNPMDKGTWWATVQGVTKSRTGPRDWACTHAVVPCPLLIDGKDHHHKYWMA